MLTTEIVARLDERAATQVATRLKNEMTRAGTVSGEAYSKALAEAADKYKFSADRIGAELEKQFASHGQRAGQSFGTGFHGQMIRSLPGVGGFASALAGYEGAAAKTGAVAGRALGMAFTGAVGGLVGAAGYTLFKGFERYEAIDAARGRLMNLNQTLQATGKHGVDVAAVMKTVNDVVLNTPFSLDKAFAVATNALASNTGDLKRFMTDVADAAGFAQEPIDAVGQAFLKIANQGKVSMDELNNELRNMPIQAWLADTMGKSGAEITKLIHDNKIGLEELLRTVEQHAPGFAKSAGQTVAGQIDILKATIARSGANLLGALFGSPTEGNNTLVESLKHINTKLDDVGKWINAHKAEIRDFFKNAAEVAKDLATEVGKVAKYLGEHKALIEGVVVAFGAWKAIEGIAAVITGLQTINAFLGGIPGKAAEAKAAMAGLNAPGGAGGPTVLPAPGGGGGGGFPGWLKFLPLLGVGAMPDVQDMPLPGGASDAERKAYGDAQAKGDRAAAERIFTDVLKRLRGGGAPTGPGGTLGGAWQNGVLGPGTGSPQRTWTPGPGQATLYWDPAKGGWVDAHGNAPTGAGPAGGPILPPSGAADGGKKPHLPKAPVVPYDTSLPAGFDNLPMSAGLFSAESSYLDARQKLAEKQARLTQLEHDGAATAQDVLDARNDVITTQRDFQQNELRLYEERDTILNKHNKQLKSLLAELGDIGAGLDQDFGISKGLAGIAENITKFVANLAAAPLLGQLAASQVAQGYKPGEAGQGLLGSLALQGAFGPQYTGPGSIAQSLAKSGLPGMRGGAGGGALNWDALAAKESGGNWGANTGNGFFGGLQFDQATWNSSKPPGAPGSAAQATREQQIQAGMAAINARGGPQSLWPQNWGQLGWQPGGGAGAVPGGPSGAAGGKPGGPPPDENTIRQWAQSMFGIPNSFGTGSWENASHDYDGGWHHPGGAKQGYAFDFHGQPDQMAAMANYIAQNYAAQSLELIYGGRGFDRSREVKNGKFGDVYGDALNAAHTDHVHWATDMMPTLPGGMPTIGPGGVDPSAFGAPGGGGLQVAPAGYGPGMPQTGGPGLPDIPGGPQSGVPGPGLPGLPGTSNPTRIGGVAPPKGKGSGFGGIGGLPMAAASAAAGMAGMMAPGSGAAAQSMMQLANRAIGFMGQAAGIGVQGLAETFLPAGSDLAANMWLTKIAGGFAGAQPMLPNIAGKGDDQGDNPTPEQVVGQGKGLDGRPSGLSDPVHQGGDTDNSKSVTNNVTVNGANVQNEQSMANTVSDHQNAMYT